MTHDDQVGRALIGRIRRKGLFFRTVTLLIAATMLVTYTVPVSAQLPQGGTLVRGDATWSDDGTAMEVIQTTSRAVIDWNSFSIGAENSVIIEQPDDSSVLLNRVLGDDPSEILGTLQSNGGVFLVNPHGVIFGKDATIDVGALVASALWMDIDDADNSLFWDPDSELDLAWGESDGLAFAHRDGDPYGDVVNLARISANADDSYVFLLGPALVQNEGRIDVRGSDRGHVGLGAGGEVRFRIVENDDGDMVRRFIVDKATAQALVENSAGAKIDASGAPDGVVLLGAAGLKELRQSVVNQQGVVWAKRMEIKGGDSGTVVLGGDLSNVSNWDMEIDASGERIAIESDEGRETIVQAEDMALTATEEIAVNSPLLYRSWSPWRVPYWDFDAPTILIDAPVAAYDDESRKPNNRMTLYIENSASDTLTIRSSADGTIEAAKLRIDGKKGAVELDGRVDVSDSMSIRFDDAVSTLRLSHPDNRLGDLRLGSLTAENVYIRNGEGALMLSGTLDIEGDVDILTVGGNLVLENVQIEAQGLTTLAATGGGVFVNNVGPDAFAGPGRVRIYSSSDAGAYNPGGLENWEYDDDTVALGEDPAAPSNVIYFLNAAGSLVVVVQVVDQQHRYGDLKDTSQISLRYYYEDDPSQEFDPAFISGLGFQVEDGEGTWTDITELTWRGLGAGTHTVRGIGADGGVYRLKYVPGKVTLTPRPLTVTIGNAERLYGAGNDILAGTGVTFEGFATWDQRNWRWGDHYTLESVAEDADVGEYDIDFIALPGDLKRALENYDITYVPGTLEVTPRRLVIDVDGALRWYGDPNDFSSAIVSVGSDGDGLALDHTLADLGIDQGALTSPATSTSAPGLYDLQLDPAALSPLAKNYDITLSSMLEVTRRPVTLTANDITIRYLDDIPSLLYAYTHSDLGDGVPIHFGENWDWPIYQLRVETGRDPLDAGDYPIEWHWPYSDDPVPHPYYELSYAPGTLTVVPRPIGIEVHDYERYYGFEPEQPEYGYTITGIPEGVASRLLPQVSFSTPGVDERSDAGLYPGAVVGSADHPNYEITWTRPAGDLTILPAALTLQGRGGTKIYGDTIELGWEIRAARPWDGVPGLAPWDRPEDVVANVKVRSDGVAVSARAGGHYPVTVLDYELINPNYVIEDVYDGTVNVLKRDLYVSVGDVQYHLNERKPYPIIRFDNVAPHETAESLLADGCLHEATLEYCNMGLYGGDDPYFFFDRSQGRVVHGGWHFDYNGPWRWTFTRYSRADTNYRLIHGDLGHEIILPALTEDEIIDLIINNPRRRRDAAFSPEPPPEGESGQSGGKVIQVNPGPHVIEGTHSWFTKTTAGFPNESQEILGRALAKYMQGPNRYTLTATQFEELYERLKQGDEELFAQLFPYLVAELHAILEKDERDLTAGERAYVEHLALVIQAERRRTAQLAVDALNEWRNNQNRRRSTGPPLNNLFDYGGGVPDYVKNAATQAEIGIGTHFGTSDRMMTRFVEVMAGIAGTIGAGAGGGLVGSLGALNSLVPYIFPFAKRGGEAIVALSGASAGAAIVGSVVMVSAIAGLAIADLVGQRNVERSIEESVRRAEGPPPTFSELKAMMQTEEGQVQLLMHQMNALARFMPGGEGERAARWGLVLEGDGPFWSYMRQNMGGKL